MEHHGNTFHGTPFSNRVGAHSGESTLLLDLQNKLDAERDTNMSCPGALTFKPWDMPKYLSFLIPPIFCEAKLKDFTE